MFTPPVTCLYVTNKDLKQFHTGNCIGGVAVSMLASSAVDCGFEPRSGPTEEYKLGMCCFSAKQAALRSKSKDWLARNQNNVFRVERYVYPGIVFPVSWHHKNPTQYVGLQQSGHHHHFIANLAYDIAEELLSWH